MGERHRREAGDKRPETMPKMPTVELVMPIMASTYDALYTYEAVDASKRRGLEGGEL